MSYRVVLSNQADEDIRGIYEYIAYDLQSQQNAIGQLDRLEKEILLNSFCFIAEDYFDG